MSNMRRLEGPEIQSYDVLSGELAERVRIVQAPLLPFGSSAMAVGRFVLLRTDDDRSGSSKLLAHELVHVRQWHEAGRWAFLRAYFGDYLRGLRHHRRHRDAYRSIRAEQQAFTEADDWQRRHPPSQ